MKRKMKVEINDTETVIEYEGVGSFISKWYGIC